MTLQTLDIPTNLDEISEEQMLAIAEDLNALEPSSGLVPSLTSGFWNFESIEAVQVLASLSVTLLFFTIFLLAIPAIKDLFSVKLNAHETVHVHKSFGTFYRRYFS